MKRSSDIIGIISIIILFVTSCVTNRNKSYDSDGVGPDSNDDSVNVPIATIFDRTIHLDEQTAIKELSDAGLLKVDSIHNKDGVFQGAVVEFAGVKFGMNRGFIFLTSMQNEITIDSLVNRISKYYGEPMIDDNGEPEWCYYHWNLYDTVPGVPYIRIRPVHSDEGGLMMSWIFNH